MNQRETLTRADIQGLVARLQAVGVPQIQFSGGEPLQRHEDLLAILSAARPCTDFWIATSGWGLTAKRAQQLKRAGLTGTIISLDHWHPPKNDAFRGMPGAHTWVTSAAAAARNAGLVVGLSLCATREFTTSENLYRYVQHARELGIGFIQILEPKPIGHYAGKDVALRPEQVRLLESFFLTMNYDSKHLRDPAVDYPAYYQRRGDCFGAGQRYLYIDTDGGVHPCPFCRNPMGNALTDHPMKWLARLRALGCPAKREPCSVPDSSAVTHGKQDRG